jgi:hypothetical protein
MSIESAIHCVVRLCLLPDARGSGLKIIRDRARSHFFAVQGASRVVDRVSMSGEQRRNAKKWSRPFGLQPKIGASGVAVLENSTTILCARRLAITDFRLQHGHE